MLSSLLLSVENNQNNDPSRDNMYKPLTAGVETDYSSDVFTKVLQQRLQNSAVELIQSG